MAVSERVEGQSGAPPPRRSVLGHRNFALLWGGLIVSNSGSWMQIVAQGYLVYHLSGSPLLLGAVSMARAVPMIVLPPFGGVVADRIERLKLLKFTQASNFIVAFAQGLVVSLHVVTIWQLGLLGFLSGAVNAFDQPTRQALLPDLVPREDLGKAIALNSSAWQGSALFGPTLAGVTIAIIGVDGAFYLNAFSFLAVLVAVYCMRGVPERREGTARMQVRNDLIAGLRFVRATPLIFTLLLMATVTSVFGRSFQQLLPVFAQDVYHRPKLGLGLLYAAPGVGTLVGAFAIAILRDASTKGRFFLAGTFAFSATIVWFAVNHSFPLGLVLLFGTGLASIVFSSFMTTMIQLESPDDMRGRVMSLVTVTMQGFSPLGSLLTGALATLVGTPEAVAGSALVVAVAALVVLVAAPSVRNYGIASRPAPIASVAAESAPAVAPDS
jgi:MFS family permease